MKTDLDPSTILPAAFGFWHSKVLLTAVEFGVFTKLANRRLTGAELGAELDFHPRGIADFFDSLVAMRFLGRDGDGPQAKYFNTPDGAMFLDEASPRYIGGILILSIEVAKKHSHLKCISFDLPPVEPIAKKQIAAAGLDSRIGTAAGDFFQEPLPKADVITMGMILHDWNLPKKMHLIRSAFDALPPGGYRSAD